MKGLLKRKFIDVRIRTKLAIGFAAVFLVVLLVASIGALSVASVSSSAEDATQIHDRLNAIGTELQAHVAAAQREVSDFSNRAAVIGGTADGVTGPRIAAELKASRELIAEATRLDPRHAKDLTAAAQQLDQFESSYKFLVTSRTVRGTGTTGRQGEFQSHARAAEDLLVARTGVEKLLTATMAARRIGSDYMQSGEVGMVARGRAAFQAAQSELEANTTLRPDDKTALRAEFDAQLAAFNDIVDADLAVRAANSAFVTTSGNVTSAARVIATAGLAASQAAREDISSTSSDSLRLIVLITLVGVLMAALFVIVLARTITHPLGQLAEVANRMSLGELDVAIEVEGNDEVGQLAESLRRMQASLRAAIERLRTRRAA